ncbi:D-erythrulose reductase-like [Uloborus diversus]|uniref:D-erythrulose reductase-like n=1 Tax=Uloborus diversus TaxID=327109 RepID=UPI002409D941|nr:D-erythrulose reductase-like [Uloborus diversus]
MEANFTNKRALVTGAGRGIGRSIAIELAKRGAKVVALSRTKEHLDTLKKEVPDIEIVSIDIGKWKETESLVKSLGRFDLLVNNAAIADLQEVGSITEEEVDKIFAVNFKAAVNISQIVADGMKCSGKGGSIVNLSSQAALIALHKHAMYCASKAALDHFSKVMALELGPHQIRVNSVNPTVVSTEMAVEAWGDPDVAAAMKAKIPLRRFCEIDDVVKTVIFLLSDQSAMITGAQIPIDGGYIIH